MSAESLLVILLVGLIAGWLAGQIVQGTGFGLIADIAIGIVGALIGSWLLPQLGIHLGTALSLPLSPRRSAPCCFYLFSGSCTGGADGEFVDWGQGNVQHQATCSPLGSGSRYLLPRTIAISSASIRSPTVFSGLRSKR